MSARMGTDLQSSAMMLGKALNDPTKGIAKLSKAGIQFSAEQVKTIKAMQAGGNAAGAQAIMLKELERQFGGAAAAAQAANPGDAAKDSWNDFKETVGEIALRVLPKLTDQMKRVLDGFNNLSPGMQSFAVGAAAVAAGLGPILAVTGPLIGVVGRLIPLMAGIGGTAGAAGVAAGAGVGGFAALSAVVLPLTAAALAGYHAWKNWDTIAPILKGWASGVKTNFDEVAKKMEDFTTKVANFDKRHGTRIEIITDKDVANFQGNVERINFWLKRLEDHTKMIDRSIAQMAASGWASFQDMRVRVNASVNGMVDGIKAAFSGKLAAAIDWVKTKAREVGDAFFRLYDRVVGHSYIPDMVDGIAAQMGRLDAVMVAPVKKGTEKAAEAFRALAAEVRPLMDRLLPEAAEWRKFQDELATIDRARKAGEKGGGVSGETADAMRERLQREGLEDQKPTLDQGPLVDWDKIGDGVDPAIEKMIELRTAAKDTTAQMIEQFAGMARDVAGSLKNMAGAFKSGDILGGLTGLLDIVTQVAGMFRKTPTAPAAPVFDRTPGFAQGGSFNVGGRAGVDKNLIQFRATKGERVDITKPGSRRGMGGGMTIDLRGAVMTEDLIRQMADLADGAAVRGALGGVSLSASDSRRRRRRSLTG